MLLLKSQQPEEKVYDKIEYLFLKKRYKKNLDIASRHKQLSTNIVNVTRIDQPSFWLRIMGGGGSPFECVSGFYESQ